MTGFTLLPVVLAMSLIAAIAFLLNRDNGMNTSMVSHQMDTDRARYAAEAGLQAANAKIQSLGCTGGYPVVGTPVTNTSFGGASYSAYASASSGNTTNLFSTGTYNNTSVTLTRNNVVVYQLSPNTYTLQPDASTGLDTYIDSANEKNYGNVEKFSIKKDAQHMLFKFDLSAFPAGSRPLSAYFSIYGSGGVSIGLEYFRMTSDWVEGTGASSPLDGATWNTSNGSTAWTAGGNHHPVKLNATPSGSIFNSWAFFDATDITTAWLSGQYPNHGIIAKSIGELGTYKYTSSDDSDAVHRPKITFNYLVPCGATGPSDPTGATATLSPTADSFNDSGATSANNGASTTIKTYYTPTRENRILMQFDTSSIPAGKTIQSATLRMYVSAVASSTTNAKSIWANAINESWVEGAGIGTNKTCPTITAGTSWNYRTGCTNWSFIHPPNTAQAWTAMANMPTARAQHVVATVKNKIYAIGGYSFTSGYLNKVEEYNPATNTWITKANMPTARANAAIAVVNNIIYVMGGTNGAVLNKTEAYDPSTDSWTTKANMLSSRTHLSAAVVNNKIYAVGGSTTGSNAVKNNEEYNPATNTWATKTLMTTARMWLSAQAVSDKVYAIGGWTGSASLNKNEVYDPVGNSWSNKANMPTGTDSMSSAVLGNKIYLISGYQGSTLTNKVWMYDTLSNAYTAQPNYPVAMNEPAAAAVNGKIYSMGGNNGASTYFSNHYQYDTGSPTPVATASDEATSASPLASGFNKGWINFDLKPLVQEWVDGVRPNNGVVIYTEVADQFSINSRENSSNNPQLIVTY